MIIYLNVSFRFFWCVVFLGIEYKHSFSVRTITRDDLKGWNELVNNIVEYIWITVLLEQL